MNLGAFELIKPIGEGGMGAVWLGKHGDAGIDVAVKVMHPEVMDDPEYREAFETEVRSVASLDHPNIVTILDFGQVPKAVAKESKELAADSPYLVMEFARGGSVEDYFHELTWPDVREMLLVVLDALAHAHARDVIHRDLKPENILVGCEPNWSVKLTDFGLAHASDRFKDAGKVETAWGTPQYMAPEQLRGFWREYGPWTDLYGLGCMAYELICGDWPYNGDTVWAIGDAHINDPIPELTPRFEVPAGAQAWVHKLMAKQRRHRFLHAADAAYALAQLPSMDETQRFGVLFDPPRPTGVATADVDEVVVATQVMPQLDPTVSVAGIDRGAPFEIDHGEKVVEDPAELGSDMPPLVQDWRRDCEGTISNELLGISLGLFGLRAIPLVDRDEERDWLWSMLQEVHRQKEARGVIVEGEAGTGKSEIVRWFCRRAREVGGAQFLTAHHSPLSGPADGLVPMMERFVGCSRLCGDKRRKFLSSHLLQEGLATKFELRALISLFEGRGAQGLDPGPTHQTSRSERHAIIYRYLSLLARRRPVVVWLDDIQWGLDALGFAQYVMQRQQEEPAPILVAMTARSEALGFRKRESDVLDRLVESAGVERRRLERLDEDDVRKLVLHLLRLNERLAEHVLTRSDGIPLFAVQLVEDWVARGKLVMDDDGFRLLSGADVSIPDDLHQLWDERIQGFLGTQNKEAVAHLELAATLGQEVDRKEWGRAKEVAGLNPVPGLVTNLVDEDLARQLEGGWQFAHGMLQESLERRARDEGRWEQWNDVCARTLSKMYGPCEVGVAERIAWHWIEADKLERGLEPLGRAIDEAVERSDYDHAESLIEWRDEITRERSERWRLKTRIDTARLHARRGAYRQCAQVATEAARMAGQEGYDQLEARAKLWAGVGLRALGELGAAEKALKSAHEAFQRDDDLLGAQALLELGRVEEQRGDFEKARRHFDAAREQFSALGDVYGQAQSYNALGDVMRQSGDFDAAREASLKALEHFEELENIGGIADCLNDLAEWSRMQGRLEEAEEYALESLRLYRDLGSGEVNFVRLNLGMIYLEEKKYQPASELFLSLAMTFNHRGQQGLEAQAKAGMLAANAGRQRWIGWESAVLEIKLALEATGVRNPMVKKTLSMAAEMAADAGRQDLAKLAEEIADDQERGIRHTLSTESVE